MDIRKIKKLIELLEQSQLTEMEIAEGEESIRLSRANPSRPAVTAAAAGVVSSVGESAISAESELSEGGPGLPPGHRILAPMVGTFYAQPQAEAEPFVQVGSVVNPGDTLCIIEAMKIFNQIEADRAGTVVAAPKHSGDPVEYGEVLFVID